jgi:hypothetical protein
LIGDQTLLDEDLPGLVKLVWGHRQALAQGGVSIKAESLGIGHGDEKEIERAGLMAEAVNMALTDESLIDPTELAWWTPEFVRQDGALVHGTCLLVNGVNRSRYRVPIVAAVGWR